MNKTNVPDFITVKNIFVQSQGSSSWLNILRPPAAPRALLNSIRFSLPLGAQVTVYGSEGAGKTVLLRTLAGIIRPTKGAVLVNGTPPHQQTLAAGYVSSEETEPAKESSHAVLSAFARTHSVTNAAARIAAITDLLHMSSFLHLPADTLSTAQRLRLNLARAALSDLPLVLLDDVADHLGAAAVRAMLPSLFAGRTVLVATRRTDVADGLQLPLLLLHHGLLVQQGTIEEISREVATPRTVDIWIEGLRYDLLRSVRRHPGVLEARLLPTSGFAGQRLRVQLQSARYFPALYDLVSQAPLLKVEEIPPSLQDVLYRL